MSTASIADDDIRAAERVVRAAGLSGVAAALSEMLAAHGAEHGQQRARRDHGYCQLREVIAGGRSAHAAAAEIKRVVDRYAATIWRQDRLVSRDALPQSDQARALKFDILSSGAKLLGVRALRQLFENV
jgi:hypothetical protein